MKAASPLLFVMEACLIVPESCKGGKAMRIRPHWSELLVSDSNAHLGHLFALCHFRCDGGGKRSARFGEVMCHLAGKTIEHPCMALPG